MTPEQTILAFAAAVFGVVFILVLGASSIAARSAQVRRRLPIEAAPQGLVGSPGSVWLRGFLAKNIDERVFRLDESGRGRLRKELVRAGYFSSDAVAIYLMIRALVLIGVPPVAYFYFTMLLPNASLPEQLAAAGVAGYLAYYAPKAFLSRRQGAMQTKYRYGFPDMMDLLLVCVDAGLSLESALERVASEITEANRELGINLSLVGMEVRAGRGTMEALESFADRVGIDEARSLTTLLRQSSELGTSISGALRVYSDEMRDRRMARAEEKAHALPVKLVIPLGLFIFPVILIMVLFPAIIRLIGIFF